MNYKFGITSNIFFNLFLYGKKMLNLTIFYHAQAFLLHKYIVYIAIMSMSTSDLSRPFTDVGSKFIHKTLLRRQK